jgi:hypothetical protein
LNDDREYDGLSLIERFYDIAHLIILVCQEIYDEENGICGEIKK